MTMTDMVDVIALDQETLNQIVPTINWHAKQVKRRWAYLPIDEDDYAQHGIVTVMAKAVKTYKAEKGKFKHWAILLAHKSMLDYARQFDETYNKTTKTKYLNRVSYNLRENEPVTALSLNEQPNEEQDRESRIDFRNFLREISPFILRSECEMLWEYFVEDKQMAKIGESRGISEARISQIIKAAISDIRQTLRGDDHAEDSIDQSDCLHA